MPQTINPKTNSGAQPSSFEARFFDSLICLVFADTIQPAHTAVQIFRAFPKKPPATHQGRNHLLGRQTQALLTRARAQPGHAGPPSPASRPSLQSLPFEAPHRSSRMSTEPKCCKQKTYAFAKLFRCNTYKNRGVGARPLVHKRESLASAILSPPEESPCSKLPKVFCSYSARFSPS